MAPRLRLPADKLHVVHAGITPEDYLPADSPPDPPVLGFLSPMIPDKGLDVLAETFLILKKDPRLARLRLRAAGGGTAGHADYIASIRRRLVAAGVWGDVELLPNLPAHARREFLRGLSVLSVPLRRGEAAGLFLLEAMACGVPAVQPRAGACTEIIEATGGGLLCPSAEPRLLAEAIGNLLTDEPLRRELGARGRAAVAENFSARRAASRLAAIIEKAG
jgi:glycosyltransferase involved in cell wall biosynthesis